MLVDLDKYGTLSSCQSNTLPLSQTKSIMQHGWFYLILVGPVAPINVSKLKVSK
ncbi:hypothetical protein SERLADRAFT_389111 [Serpula lacrymans var. lacrymans S7.9]|uniref:Uncharacterized protein n=1 Tax=Serpula lacrymans var. lacrymans (strain S7.9) TaxID=578457 RepID=F8NVT1_SERL9|nr:uncharacterized protein SERLADRAFT_389111 [Serpula lacrymans var. lacrymans S7.9]EGO24242.1 hypothetical protein SERLADRAFT_389111 [Serpula lacrymans var. lacrymans S7.9]